MEGLELGRIRAMTRNDTKRYQTLLYLGNEACYYYHRQT